MKLSVVSGVLGGMSLDESLKYLKSIGVPQFELGVGGYPGTKHADAKVLVADKAKRDELVETFKKYDMKFPRCPFTATACIPTRKSPRLSRRISRRRACLRDK